MKRGFVFTLDVLLSITIAIFIVIFLTKIQNETSVENLEFEYLNLMARDILSVLSNLKVYEVQSETINKLILAGEIREDDANKSVLDLIASFWYGGNKSLATNISKEILSVFDDVCISLEADDVIYQNCNKSGNVVVVASRIETGYEMGKPASGYIARAYLRTIKNKTTSEYTFFGGYEGDGNITKWMFLPEDAKIVSSYIEGVFGNNFTLYINGNFSGIYNISVSSVEPSSWIICNQTFNSNYCKNIKPGKNEFQINFSSKKNAFVGGGFLKITFNTSQLSNQTNSSTYNFPGIKGIINIYSSFDVPGNLRDMEISLKYKTNYTVFLNVGNKTVWRSNATEVNQKISNSTLSNILSFYELSNKTVPIRFGTEMFTEQIGGKADVILITDVSGSMNWRLNSNTNGVNKDCSRVNESDTNRISLAKCLDKEFVEIVLNVSGNRVGLVAYSGIPNYIPTANSQMIISYHNLSNNSTSLINQINSYTPSGATGICGALRMATNLLLNQSNSSRSRFIVLMTDGIANVQCSPSNENSTIGCIPRICPNTGYCLGGGCLYSDCGDWVSNKSVNDAIYEGCRAANYGITVYTIGFGPVSSCPISNFTLNEIAKCGRGKYYNSSDADQLMEIYRKIAGEIVSLSYETQRINISGNVSYENVLLPESYIAINYTPNYQHAGYGEISLTFETPKIKDMIDVQLNESVVSGGFYIPYVLRINNAKTTSYSSEYWTDKVMLKSNSTEWNYVYKLSDFGNVYQALGDPFIVQIPPHLLEINKTNYIAISIGLSPTNYTRGSLNNRVIYEAVINGVVGYGNAFNTSEEAINDAYNRLLSQVEGYVDVDRNNVEVKQESISGIKWLWGPSVIKVVVWKKS